jgi:ADP-ribosylglycohydrolase
MAVDLSSSSELTPAEIETLGGGWVAEEALAIGICCALTGGDDFCRSVIMAVNHSGDSDSTGSLAGNLIGVQYGMETIPDDWLSGLEMKDVITEVASDLADTFADNRL